MRERERKSARDALYLLYQPRGAKRGREKERESRREIAICYSARQAVPRRKSLDTIGGEGGGTRERKR